MSSPKDLKLLPWVARTLITLFVRGIGDKPLELGSCAVTMNCSFRTSCTTFSGFFQGLVRWTTHENSDNGVMVWIVYVIREVFDEREKLAYESIVNMYYHNISLPAFNQYAVAPLLRSLFAAWKTHQARQV